MGTFLMKNKAYVHAHPNFALVVSNKIIECHSSQAMKCKTGEEREAFQMYCHSLYKGVFGCEFPTEKTNTNTDSGDDSQALLDLFYKLNQNAKNVDPSGIHTKCTSSLECTFTMNDPKTKQPLFKTNVTIKSMYDEAAKTTVFTAYISYFTILKESRGQRKCAKAFEALLNRLKSLDVKVITLYIGSSTPLKACSCYIHGALQSGYFPLEKDIEGKCKDSYKFVCFHSTRSSFKV